MYCYDENFNLLAVVSCFPKVGEKHSWGEDVYICVGKTTGLGWANGMIFKGVK